LILKAQQLEIWQQLTCPSSSSALPLLSLRHRNSDMILLRQAAKQQQPEDTRKMNARENEKIEKDEVYEYATQKRQTPKQASISIHQCYSVVNKGGSIT
jgi:hypothetical protein